MQSLKKFDVIIVGGGAAGLMAAAHAGKRGKKTLLLEASEKLGEKIRISGGGRCNFTNLNINANNYLSSNPHFIKSALAQYNQFDFIKLVEKYQIAYHEKTLGQLFCDDSSANIINMLKEECLKAEVEIRLGSRVRNISKGEDFLIYTENEDLLCDSLIIACGGLSIPKLGANDFGYKVAKQFGHNIIETHPALVPVTVSENEKAFYSSLSGIAINSIISTNKVSFRENILFTHRGLSGPAILQVSSYIDYPSEIIINLLPDIDLESLLNEHRYEKILLSNFLKNFLPKRFVDALNLENRIVDYSLKMLLKIANDLQNYKVKIHSNEGYAKAEVTRGGVDTRELSSKTMESNKCKKLFFIGEVVDVTGWLGGYNFQWAWSSGYVAGNNV